MGECGRVKKCGGLTCSQQQQQLKMLTILVLDTYKSKPVYLAQKKDDKDVLCGTEILQSLNFQHAVIGEVFSL